VRNRWYERVPLLLAAAALLMGGAAEEAGAAQQMLAAGFVVLGTWVGVEARNAVVKLPPDDPEQPPQASP
jgi:disulfide bond formation protein DsbB